MQGKPAAGEQEDFDRYALAALVDPANGLKCRVETMWFSASPLELYNSWLSYYLVFHADDEFGKGNVTSAVQYFRQAAHNLAEDNRRPLIEIERERLHRARIEDPETIVIVLEEGRAMRTMEEMILRKKTIDEQALREYPLDDELVIRELAHMAVPGGDLAYARALVAMMLNRRTMNMKDVSWEEAQVLPRRIAEQLSMAEIEEIGRMYAARHQDKKEQPMMVWLMQKRPSILSEEMRHRLLPSAGFYHAYVCRDAFRRILAKIYEDYGKDNETLAVALVSTLVADLAGELNAADKEEFLDLIDELWKDERTRGDLNAAEECLKAFDPSRTYSRRERAEIAVAKAKAGLAGFAYEEAFSRMQQAFDVSKCSEDERADGLKMLDFLICQRIAPYLSRQEFESMREATGDLEGKDRYRVPMERYEEFKNWTMENLIGDCLKQLGFSDVKGAEAFASIVLGASTAWSDFERMDEIQKWGILKRFRALGEVTTQRVLDIWAQIEAETDTGILSKDRVPWEELVREPVSAARMSDDLNRQDSSGQAAGAAL